MNTHELQLGDWVRILSPYKSRIIYCQVTALDDNSIWQEGWKEISGCEHYEPIPLSAEILKYIGFDDTPPPMYFLPQSYLWRDRNWRIDLTLPSPVTDNKTLIRISAREREGIHASAHYRSDTIKYVHELQHAMRICGIGEEIKLPMIWK